MTYTLGIHDGHNSAACLLQDGEVVYAVQEERFRRLKNFWGPPIESIRSCLSYAHISAADLDAVVFASYQHPTRSYISREEYLSYTRNLLRSSNVRAKLRHALAGIASVLKERPYDLRERLKLYAQLGFDRLPRDRIKTVQHHVSHFATAAFGSENGNDEDLLVFTVDGYGDGECATVSIITKDGQIKKLLSLSDAHPFAKIYAWVTVYLGFVHLEHEYKLMGMAPYASPSRARRMAEKFASLLTFRNGRWAYHRGAIRCEVDDHLIYRDIQRICEFERFDDVCGGLQLFSENMIVSFVEYWVEKTGVRNIALSGGFFMNVKANKVLRSSKQVDRIYVFPSCGDETNAIGAAMFHHFVTTGCRPKAIRQFTLGDAIPNVSIGDAALEEASRAGVDIKYFSDIEDEIARLLASGEIVARVKGREEFGARALGNRSILANPSDWRNVQVINDMIKSRDFWMPFATSVIDEDRFRYLKNVSDSYDAHYMIMTYDALNTADIIAGMHPKDCTIRPQVVTKEFCPEYYHLIQSFKRRTGIGAVLNTSYNLHGLPLVHSVADAVDVFMKCGLKYLAVGNVLLSKPTMEPAENKRSAQVCRATT